MPVLVFDVNETLLDLSHLKPHFVRMFHNEALLSQWFSQLLRHSLVTTMTGAYTDFGTLARDALYIIAKKQGVVVSQQDEDALLTQLGRLPPHTDVIPNLKRLKTAGFTLITLTNSPYTLLESQLAFAGIREFFTEALSVDAVQRFKPHPATYEFAAQTMGVTVEELCMIAAHNWDITGAIRAGCKAAFVARPGMVLGQQDETPDIIAANLSDVTDGLLENYS